MRATLILLTALLSTLAIACGGDDSPGATPTQQPRTAAPSPSPAPSPTVEPGGGISAVEAIINAARSVDTETLRSFLRTTRVACATDVQGAGGPPICRPGEPDGTLVDVVWFADCEGHWDRLDEVHLQPLDGSEMEFYGLYEATARVIPEGADVVAVFTRTMPGNQIPPIGVTVVIDDGAIMGMQFGCGTTAAGFVEVLGFGEPIEIENAPLQ
jgi:hypothetical protein